MRTPTPSTRAKRALHAELKVRELNRRTAATENLIQQNYSALPLGIVGRAYRATSPAASAPGSLASAVSVLAVTAPVTAGRLYEVRAEHFGLYGSAAGTVQANLTFTLDTTPNGTGITPTVSSTVLDQTDVQVVSSGVPQDAQLERLYAPGTLAGVLSVLLCFFSVSAGTAHMNGTTSWPIELVIEDKGVDPGITGTVY